MQTDTGDSPLGRPQAMQVPVSPGEQGDTPLCRMQLIACHAYTEDVAAWSSIRSGNQTYRATNHMDTHPRHPYTLRLH